MTVSHLGILTPRALADSSSAASKERRREARYPTGDAARIRVLPIEGDWAAATVVDISRSGVRVELSSAVPSGAHVEIMVMPRKVVIFGEVRHCRRSGGIFHIGIQIEGVVFPRPDTGAHLDDDQLSLYVAGRGLTSPEVIRAKDHLGACDDCCRRMHATASALRPRRRPQPVD